MSDEAYRTKLTLTTAAGIIKMYGWTQGEYGHAKIGYCLEGALMRAREDLWGRSQVHHTTPYNRSLPSEPGRPELMAYIRKHYKPVTVAEFNDTICLDSEMAIVTLIAAALEIPGAEFL